MLTYTVVTPFIAVNPGERLFYIPADAVIKVAGEVHENGLVDVVYQGRRVLAFLRDIQVRAKVVREASSPQPAFSFGGE